MARAGSGLTKSGLRPDFGYPFSLCDRLWAAFVVDTMDNFASQRISIEQSCARLATLVSLPGLLPKVPANQVVPEADLTVSVFARHCQRTYYHALHFLDEVQKIRLQAPESRPESFGAPVSDAPFFEFDAFVYSAKSIMEGKMRDRFESMFTGAAKAEFSAVAKELFESFLKPFLRSIRNEALHLNHLGTSFASMAFFTKSQGQWTMELRSNYALNGKPAGLLELFAIALPRVNSYVDQMVRLIARDMYARYGQPHETTMRIGDIAVSLPSFDIRPEPVA